MKKTLLFSLLLCVMLTAVSAQRVITPFEKSGGKQTATYSECLDFYWRLARESDKIIVGNGPSWLPRTALPTDAAYELNTVEYFSDNKRLQLGSEPAPITILINNAIHPGEPDGVDACMMLMRDAVEGRIKIPDNVHVVVIPVYNIGGALNRNNSTRVNQDGPKEYGFRGNSKNLDLNRDFTKRDARESASFAKIFQAYNPAIFLDNHVSDGADYQHTMTLVSTQYDKLGGTLGKYFRERLDPMLYRRMDNAGWPMSPYVNAEGPPENGWTAFYDPPRFSSGYAALFNTIAWVPETHMLKPFDQRVKATYALLKEIILLAGEEGDTILTLRKKDKAAVLKQTMFPLAWADSAASSWRFKGYETAYKKSDVTGQQRLYYDHSKPIDVLVPIRDHFAPQYSVQAPKAYIIPHGWYQSIAQKLDLRGIVPQLSKDSLVDVTAYTIDSFKTSPTPYEGHYKHSAIHATPKRVKMKFLKGDYIINLENNPARRFLIEMLEPEGEDAYFAWNFFDAILQRKEGYSDYRWEDVAARELRDHPEIKAALEERKRNDTNFAKDAAAQLYFVYKQSRWYESAHMRYPVYRIE